MPLILDPRTGLPYRWDDTIAESGWGASYNDAMLKIGTLLHLSVLERRDEPPESPQHGDRYIVGTSPTGDWQGHTNEIAVYIDDAVGTMGWVFYAPKPGWLAYLEDTDSRREFDGSSWNLLQTGGGGGGIADTQEVVADSEDTTINLASGRLVRLLLQDDTSLTIEGAGPVDQFIVVVRDGDAHEIEWPENIYWPQARVPDLSSADVLDFFTYDGGETWYASRRATELSQTVVGADDVGTVGDTAHFTTGLAAGSYDFFQNFEEEVALTTALAGGDYQEV